MITNQFRIYLCHFHCSHWQNHLLNFTFREKGPLVLVKTFSSLFRNKLLIPHANCYGHVPFDMFHHIPPKNDTLGFLGENIWVSSIGRCATLGYKAVLTKFWHFVQYFFRILNRIFAPCFILQCSQFPDALHIIPVSVPVPRCFCALLSCS